MGSTSYLSQNNRWSGMKINTEAIFMGHYSFPNDKFASQKGNCILK